MKISAGHLDISTNKTLEPIASNLYSNGSDFTVTTDLTPLVSTTTYSKLPMKHETPFDKIDP